MCCCSCRSAAAATAAGPFPFNMFVISIAEYGPGGSRVIATAVLLVRWLRRRVVISPIPPILRLEAAAGLSSSAAKGCTKGYDKNRWRATAFKGFDNQQVHTVQRIDCG